MAPAAAMPGPTRCATPAIATPLAVPPSWPPTLVVVIDTEEEFDWSAPFDAASTQVANIAEQPFAQELFDAHGVVPTYAVDYPVVASDAAVATLAGFLADGRCEIGAHLHPWVTPPHQGPIDAFHSYGGNLPAALEHAKLATLIDAVRGRFGVQPRTFRAGRYGIGRDTPAMLCALGIETDVSVVPGFDFSADGGPDFRAAPDTPYRTPEGLCEMPDSAVFLGRLAARGPAILERASMPGVRHLRLGGILARLGLLERLRLSPEGHGLADMIRQVRRSHAAGARLFMLSYHSSSLLPGGAPYVRTPDERTDFLRTLNGFLHFFIDELGGRADTASRVAAALARAEMDRRTERSIDSPLAPSGGICPRAPSGGRGA